MRSSRSSRAATRRAELLAAAKADMESVDMEMPPLPAKHDTETTQVGKKFKRLFLPEHYAVERRFDPNCDGDLAFRSKF
jgi:hypothetical protein